MKFHVQYNQYEEYVIGFCVEYPGVISNAWTEEELVDTIRKALPGHIAFLKDMGLDANESIIVEAEL